jgi:hypothetical protein
MVARHELTGCFTESAEEQEHNKVSVLTIKRSEARDGMVAG